MSVFGGNVSYFAAAVTRDESGWLAAEVSLADAADLEDVADRLRDVNPTADVSLLFIESDDAYLAILRLDHGEDLRLFASDIAFAEESRLGALLLGDLGEPVAELAAELAAEVEATATEETGEGVAAGPDSGGVALTPFGEAEPAGDADLLADLGVSQAKLLELCSHEGMLPSDIIAEVCQAIGCGDEVEELREA